MARKIILKEDGLAGSGTAPTGYRYLGYDDTVASEKSGGVVSDLSESGYLNTVVEISSAEILTMGDNPIQLLPNLGNGYYYTGEIAMYYYSVTTKYSMTGNPAFRINTASASVPPLTGGGPIFVTEGINTILFPFPFGAENIGDTGCTLQLTTDDGNNPTGGDGTVRIVIKYKIRTFGA